MKSIITLCLMITGSFICSSINGQSSLNNLKNGNYKAVLNKMAPEVSIQIDRKNQTVNKEKAIVILKTKLNSFNPIEWEELHRGSSEAKDGNYVIARLTNEQGDSVRLFMQFKKSSEGPQISSIRIRKAL